MSKKQLCEQKDCKKEAHWIVTIDDKFHYFCDKHMDYYRNRDYPIHAINSLGY